MSFKDLTEWARGAFEGTHEELQKLLQRTKEPVIKPGFPVDLEAQTVVQLKATAKQAGLKGYSSLKKAELIDLIESSSIADKYRT